MVGGLAPAHPVVLGVGRAEHVWGLDVRQQLLGEVLKQITSEWAPLEHLHFAVWRLSCLRIGLVRFIS